MTIKPAILNTLMKQTAKEQCYDFFISKTGIGNDCRHRRLNDTATSLLIHCFT